MMTSLVLDMCYRRYQRYPDSLACVPVPPGDLQLKPGAVGVVREVAAGVEGKVGCSVKPVKLS